MLLRDRPAVLVYGAAAILMAHVGAFDTSGAAAVVRYPYFLSISLGGGLLGGLLADRLLSPRARPPRRLVRPAVLIAATVAATTPLVWLLAA